MNKKHTLDEETFHQQFPNASYIADEGQYSAPEWYEIQHFKTPGPVNWSRGQGKFAKGGLVNKRATIIDKALEKVAHMHPTLRYPSGT